jgi:hypothetical protein
MAEERMDTSLFSDFLKTVGDLGGIYIQEKYGPEDTPYNQNPQTGTVSPQGSQSPDTNVWSGYLKSAGNVMTSPTVGTGISILLFALAGVLVYKAVT